jgi:hypothetical protein
MGWVLAAAVFLSPVTPLPQSSPVPELLPARDLALPPAIVQTIEPISFDLIDFREAQLLEKQKSRPDGDPHTFFIIKRHIGASIGYDNTVLHGSVGFYMTVAEWGRWNFGVPSIGLGAGRYPIYDRAQNRSVMTNEATVFISVASVHYRVGYVRALGANWYINLEQVYDLRYNLMGSQFGVSFSSK